VDAIILPGSKSSIADLAWLEESGLGAAVRAFALRGGAVVGLCGGYQMLGKAIRDPLGAEGGGERAGLGLLGHETVFSTEKSTKRTAAVVEQGDGAFAFAGGVVVEGYEVHMGMTSQLPGQAVFRLEDGSGEGGRSADGRVWGTYLHGVFDKPAFRRAWLRSLGWTGNLDGGESLSELRDRELDRLADQVEAAMDMKALDTITGLGLV
jgi:adenosylcobyric acid synthase